MLQLSEDCSDGFSLCSEILRHDRYVELIVSGTDFETAWAKRNLLIGALKTAGLKLRKWASSDDEQRRSTDPVGFLCPVTFEAKHLIQYLWALSIEWDAQPPEEVCSQWLQFKQTLPLLTILNIPRCIKNLSHVNCAALF